jgi:hypothetical protein
MTIENPTCPVCGNTLKATGTDPNMFYCVKRKVWVSDLGIHIDIVDATIYRTPDGKVVWQVIEIPPYRFLLNDDDKGQLTTVSKYVTLNKKPWDKQNAMAWKREVILTVQALINLPWNDKDQVLEKLKLYLLFS